MNIIYIYYYILQSADQGSLTWDRCDCLEITFLQMQAHFVTHLKLVLK